MCDYANDSTYVIRAVSSDVSASKNINAVFVYSAVVRGRVGIVLVGTCSAKMCCS